MDSCGSPEETDHYLKNKTMDGDTKSPLGSKESINDQRQSSKDNTEYLPTRCRITKPTPPKPAANPMQFVKIGPCELFRKAQQQIKKVEDVKTVRQEIRDEAEDWQANLDNWKSSRRKRQEHIIERVVEVKKFEQQEQEKGRRKSKTFNEILEERSKRKTKLSISLYEDNSNDFSDLGIGVTQSSNEPKSSKSDDNSNLANEFPKSNSDYSNVKIEDNSNNLINIQEHTENENELGYKQNYNTTETIENTSLPGFEIKWNENYKPEIDNTQNESEHTYESAIQGYRTRVSKTNLNTLPSYPSEQKTDNKTDPNVVIVPKGSILKRKKLFENDKLYEFNHYESNSSRRLSGDFAHSQSLKDRLLSLEKFTEQPLTNCLDTSQSTVNENSDIKNNNTSKSEFVRSRILMINNRQETDKPDSFDSYTDDKIKTVISNNWNKNLECVSPETNVFVRKFENNNLHHRSLDNLTDTTSESMPLDRVQSLEGLDYCHSNYPASNSSTELLILSSQYGDTDREDSGIHTADVSCSVSQADEPVEDSEITATVVVNMDKACIIDEPLITCASSQSGEYSSVDGSIQIMSPVSTECNLYTLDFSGVFVGEDFPLTAPVTVLEPPKEKPPPPPITEDLNESEKRRLNSTTRIKKELHMKRSSFLGIHSCDPPEVDASIRKPPNINSFLQKESRLEKQLYKKNQSSYSEAGDSQDSGIELERGRLSSDTWCSSLPECPVGTGIVHSRQNSEPCTTNSITSEEDEIAKKEREIIELVEKEEKWRHSNEFSPSIHYKDRIELAQNVLLTKSSEELYDQAVAEYATSEDDHSEVLRVEHELLQLEREELQRQRENMIFRESRAHLQQSNTCLKNKRLSLEDISLSSSSSNKPHTYNMFQNDAMEYRKSMPELQRDTVLVQPSTMVSRSAQVTPIKNARPILRETYEQDNFVSRNNNTVKKDIYQQPRSSLTNQKSNHPTSRHSLQLLSAAPRSRLTPQDNWVQLKQNVTESREKFNYNQHWLIQEAEQRRLSDQQKFTAPLLVQNWKLTKSEKHLPDSVIQTLTQRVQNKISLSERNLLGRRLDTVPMHYGAHSPHSVGHALPIIHHPHLMVAESQDKILSVSGKKKCSYCGNELGRGAAMIIESLCLFYHMDCFKCCVCHMQLGDGLMGTDVRVRNNKLHCHNCYSSDDGVKFSCV